MRGQAIFIELILALVAAMIIIGTATSLQTQIVTATSNTTLFPVASPQFLIAGLIVFVWLAGAILVILSVFSRRGEGG